MGLLSIELKVEVTFDNKSKLAFFFACKLETAMVLPRNLAGLSQRLVVWLIPMLKPFLVTLPSCRASETHLSGQIHVDSPGSLPFWSSSDKADWCSVGLLERIVKSSAKPLALCGWERQ